MKTLKLYMLAGVIFVSVLGTLLHFAYKWSGNNIFIGLFTPVNESIWEHTKLIFFPMLIYSIYLNRKISMEYPCINSAMLSGALCGIAMIIVLYYTYSGIIGSHFALADISIFYITVVTVFYIVYKLAISCKANNLSPFLHICNIVIIYLFIIFTFFPPDIPLFINPNIISK